MTASPTAQDWIARLALIRHPEGGWYRETYRSREHVAAAALPPRFGGARALGTAIYYLLASGERSTLHRIKSDEVWHHYAGDAVTLWLLEAPGASRVVDGGAYALMGGTVAPGFDFADFELGDRAALLAGWPAQRAIIEALT